MEIIKQCIPQKDLLEEHGYAAVLILLTHFDFDSASLHIN